MSALPAQPYPGLRPFEAEEWSIFFGRERMIDDVIDRLAKNRVVVIHGASGCGKSSLVRAGVLPKLARQHQRHGTPWLTCAMRPAGGPLWNLATEFAELEGRAGDPERIGAILSRFNRRDASLASVTGEIEALKGNNLCILVDQFEELFRFERETSREEAELFVALLARAAPEGEAPEDGADLHVVVTMRSEFLGECSRFAGLAETINRTQYLVPRMGDDALMRAVRRPAQLFGGIVDEALAERLIGPVRGREDELPLLQHGLMLMWNEAERKAEPPRRKTLDDAIVEKAGGLAALLSSHADAVMASVAKDERREKIVESLFRELTDVNAAGSAIRRPRKLADLAKVAGAEVSELREVVEAFRAPGVSFLTPYPPAPLADETIVDISHEALIRCWRRIAADQEGWLKREFDDGLAWRSLVLEAKAFEKDRWRLLPAATAEERSRLAARHGEAWSRRYGGGWPQVGELLAASRKAAARARRMTAAAVISFAALSIGASMAARFAFKAQGEADEARGTAVRVARYTVKVQFRSVNEALQDTSIQNKTALRLFENTESSNALYAELLPYMKDDPGFRADQAQILHDYGVAYVVSGDISKAESRFEESLKQFRELLKNVPSELEWRRGVAEQLDQLSQIHSKQVRYDLARVESEESLHLREGIAKDAPDDWRTYRDIASSQYDLGEYFISISQPHDALDRFHEAEAKTVKALSLIKDDAKGLEELNRLKARILTSLSQVYRGEKQKTALSEALEIRKKLYQSNQNDRGIKRDLSWSYQFLGNLAYDDRDFNLAEQYYHESFLLRKQASSDDPSDYRAKTDLAWAALNYGNVLRQLKRYDDARDQLNVASNLWREVIYQDKTNLVRRKDFAMAQVSLGDLEMDLLKPIEALDYYQEASEILENTTNMSDNPLFRMHLGNVYEKTGRALLLAGKISVAEEAFDKALQLRNPSYSKQHNSLEFQTELAQAYCSLGELQAQRNESSPALASYLECKKLARRLLAGDEKPPAADRLLGQATKALEALQQGAAERGKGKHRFNL